MKWLNGIIDHSRLLQQNRSKAEIAAALFARPQHRE